MSGTGQNSGKEKILRQLSSSSYHLIYNGYQLIYNGYRLIIDLSQDHFMGSSHRTSANQYDSSGLDDSRPLDVLLVDDDDVDRNAIKRALLQSEIKANVEECIDIESALKVFRSKQYDCILLDYRLPGLDGIEGVKVFRDDNPYCPIVMISGEGDEAVAVKAIRMGAEDYFTKSNLNPSSIQRAITNSLNLAKFRKKIDEQKSDLENFSKILIHDLKEPANSVNFLVETIRNNCCELLNEKDQELFSHVLETSHQMLQLIDTVTQYTFSSTKVLETETVDLNQVVEQACLNLRSRIQDKNARVTYDGLHTISGDKTQFVQLIQNLIGNGIKYCEEAIPEVTITSKEDGDNRIICVRDNGIGIRDEHLKKIFEVFHRLHDRETYEGTGLGLATCRKIVERHNGAIWCESKQGEGSAFYISIPYAGKG